MSQFPKINVLPGDPETSIGAFNVVRIPPDGQWSGGLAFEFCIPDEERVRRVISAMVGHEDAYMIYDWLGEQLGRSGVHKTSEEAELEVLDDIPASDVPME